MINTAKTTGLVKLSKNADNEITITAIRLTWIPGIKPVMIPQKTPMMRAIK